MPDTRGLLALINGYQVSQALHVAARLGVADRLADGPRRPEELGLDADPDALRRLLRALAAILERHPGVRGMLFDQPDVVAGVELGDRCTAVGGSFFAGVPAGGDAYVLKSVLHDWPDAEAVAILRACHAAGAPVVLLVERDLAADPRAPFSDLNMLVGPGGRERSLAEYAALLDAAGFRLAGSTTTAAAVAVIEAHRR